MIRIDILLVQRGIARSRQIAKEYVLNGKVIVEKRIIKKPSVLVDENSKIEFTGEKAKYVGRGGLKLEHALKKFDIDCSGYVCMDIGASTGGFTDCLIQNNAKKIYAVDVGKNQLDISIKENNKVICLENTDIRTLDRDSISGEIDFICTDVSFISIKKIFDSALSFLKKSGEMVFLIKPQFEVGIECIGKKGIVKDRKVHERLLKDMVTYFQQKNIYTADLCESPIKGGSGNSEYLIYLKNYNSENINNFNYRDIVDKAMTK